MAEASAAAPTEPRTEAAVQFPPLLNNSPIDQWVGGM